MRQNRIGAADEPVDRLAYEGTDPPVRFGVSAAGAERAERRPVRRERPVTRAECALAAHSGPPERDGEGSGKSARGQHQVPLGESRLQRFIEITFRRGWPLGGVASCQALAGSGSEQDPGLAYGGEGGVVAGH